MFLKIIIVIVGNFSHTSRFKINVLSWSNEIQCYSDLLIIIRTKFKKSNWFPKFYPLYPTTITSCLFGKHLIFFCIFTIFFQPISILHFGHFIKLLGHIEERRLVCGENKTISYWIPSCGIFEGRMNHYLLHHHLFVMKVLENQILGGEFGNSLENLIFR